MPRTRQLVMVGGGLAATDLSSALESTDRVKVVGYLDDEPRVLEGRLGHITELSEICTRVTVDGVLLALTSALPRVGLAAPTISGGLTVVPNVLVKVKVPASPRGARTAPRAGVADQSESTGARRLKRVIDIVATLVLLVVLAPAMVAVALAVVLTSRGPALFSQTRIGRNGREFRMFKFRSMVNAPPAAAGPDGPGPEPVPVVALVADQAGHLAQVVGPFPKLRADPRVTAVGRLIRRTSIDELPQLFNVLRGDMSLVGPRPYIPADAARIDGWARQRMSVPPGITGLWQVSGRNDVTFDDMCRLDHLYVSCWSLGLDARILSRTVGAVLRRRGAY